MLQLSLFLSHKVSFNYQPKQLRVRIWTACVVMKAKVETFKKSRGIWTVENWLTSPLLLVE